MDDAQAAQALGSSKDSGLLPASEYQFIQARMPILCVDLVPISDERPARIGLIQRSADDGGTGWCLVGGRVMRDETLTEAVARHVQATLGPSMKVDEHSLTLCRVVEYFPLPGRGEFHDPRKHAVALTYAGVCTGLPRAGGEATGFGWFQRHELDDLSFGFGQDRVVRAVLAELDGRCLSVRHPSGVRTPGETS